MTVTVYADIYFIINLLFDTLLLYITARLVNSVFKPWRLAAGGIFGACYAVICLFTGAYLPLHVAAAAVMNFIVFGRKRLILNSAVFILSSALAGGTVYGCFYMAGKDENFISALGVTGTVICILSALALTAGYMYVCKKNSASGAVHAYITVLGKEYKAFLMKDNGNLLTDPISLDPVIVVAKEVFGDKFEGVTETTFPLPLKIIPVKTAAGCDILYGFRPEKCIIREFGKAKKREVRAVIALTGGNRFTNTYDGLMPPL